MMRICNAVVDHHIQATNGEVWPVECFLADKDIWAIHYLVVSTSNWWLGHKVLVAPQRMGSVHWSDRTVTVDLSSEAVKAAPSFDPSAELDRERETGLYAHHGRPPYKKDGSKRSSARPDAR